MLTVSDLTGQMGLSLVAGADAAHAPIRWVHITELADPTPWLSGGELVLTTGMALQGDEQLRAYVRCLATHGLAGLGFGTGFDHPSLPAALADEARALAFPLFEVPYELPFIALTEKAFTRLVNDAYEALERSGRIHKRLERIVLEERGLEQLVGALATSVDATVAVLDPSGATLASSSNELELGLDDAERGVRLPVPTGGPGAYRAWLVAVRQTGELGDFERVVLQQAATVVALELMRRRVVRDTERRLAGDVLAEALSGALEATELESRLGAFGIGEQAAVLVLEVDDPSAAEPVLDRALSEAGAAALVAARGALLCAVVDARSLDPLELAAGAREALAERDPGTRAAASRSGPVAALRRAFHEARCALEASALAANGTGAPAVASYRDLGAFELILSLQDDEALRLYCDSVLGPLAQASGNGLGGDELERSLEAFIEHNGQWESAARALFCHRHTLRYRIRRIEELTGRDLARSRDRIEFWLALRGRELSAR